MAEYPNGQAIWSFLVAKIGNEYGVAGLMGNLYWESGLIPYRKQWDYSAGYTVSLQYTEDINTGVITRAQFVSDRIGYGLAQWTYPDRKAALYDRWKNTGGSIGDLYLGLNYLWWELNYFNNGEYKPILTKLQNATSIRYASDVVLTEFERPEKVSESVKQQRENTSTDIYNTYHGTSGGDITPFPVSKRKHLKSAERFLIMTTLFNRR